MLRTAAIAIAWSALSFSPSAHTRSEFVYMGSVGPAGDDDSGGFERSFEAFAQFAQRSGWRSRFYYGDVIAASRPRAPRSGAFDGDSIESEAKRLTELLKSDQFSRGDRILIAVDAHGNRGNPRTGAQTHRVQAARGYPSLDPLGPLAALARSKGVAFAIADLSCYSGHTLALERSGACVISASRPGQMGYASFSNEFARAIAGAQDGASIEDLFRAARRASTDGGFPQITTNPGRSVSQSLESVQSYVSGLETRANLFSPDCPPEPGLLRRRDFEASVVPILNKMSGRSSVVARAWNSALSAAGASTQRRLEDAMSRYDVIRERIAERTPKIRRVCFGEGQLERCASSAMEARSHAQWAQGRANDYEGRPGNRNAANLALHRANKQRWDEIAAELDAERRKREAGSLASRDDFRRLTPIQREIVEIERRLYDSAYETRASAAEADDPCRSFRF